MAKKALKSKWFRVAVEGDTTDGRRIEAAWLTQMAANYNPEKYGARVNCEHVRGLMPDGAFGAYGDVLALKTDTVEIDGEKRVALYAQISPTEELIALNKKRKKVYSSIEIDHDFAGKGEAYLVGLAITDSPASLGTEMMEFAAKASRNPLADRKQRPENLFSVAREVELEFEEEAPSILDRVKELFRSHEEERTDLDAQYSQAIETIAAEVADLQTQYRKLGAAASAQQLESLSAEVAAVKTKLTDIETALDTTPNHSQRPPATGGTGEQLTDC